MMIRLAFRSAAWALTYTLTTTLVQGLRFNPTEVDYNLNQNRTAQSPLDYWGEREGHNYTQSPENWRFPFYTLFLDRFVNGDPSNDNANGTLFEYDMLSNQLRHGGDLQGLIDSLDYIQGMGVKGLYIAGSIFINQPWGADSYSPLDLTLLDKHFGDITMWQTAIDEIHKRGMWVVLDQTMATMGDLIGFKGYLNESTPFRIEEHEVEWKSSRRYLDFDISNEYNETCEYPRFWFEDGFPVAKNVTDQLKGCYNSDFDQYGDIEAFGVHPDWQRQMAKFASVQDRLREWVPSVMARLQRFSCMTIAMLDIDGFRIDKAVQVTVDAQAEYSSAMRECARRYGKDNFMVVGEITSGNGLGSIYLGRGRQPDMKPDLAQAMKLVPDSSSDSQYFLRDDGMSALDAGAFHYSIYRFMTRFLGLSGNLEAGFDLPLDWVDAWNEMVQTNDFYNANNKKFDPRHLYGVTNQDVFRWPAIKYGTERMLLGYFITTLTLPGAPLVYYGEEQELYVLDNTAENYVFGRQAFSPAQAWRAHGCYAGNNQVYKNWPVEKARTGCLDESVGYDHRDPSALVRNIMKHMFALREKLPVLEHGWKLEKLANQTEYILLNGSTSATEFGIWSVVRAMYTDNDVQPENGTAVWLVYHNRENRTTYEFDCSSDADRVAFISPFDANTEVRNLFSQDDAITLETSAKLNNFTGTGQAGCISSITLEPFEFRAYVPKEYWVETEPMITKFEPGHDYPIDSTSAGGQLNVSLHFSVEMDCDSITKAVTILSTTVDGTGNDTSATFSGEPVCGTLANDEKLSVTGAIASVYYWNVTLSNLEDGVHQLVVTKPLAKSGASTNAIDRFLIRFGKKDNPIVFPTSANYSRSLLTTDDSDNMYVNHAAAGATKWRYSSNWGSTWSNWISYTDSSKVRIVPQGWKGSSRQEWEGVHIMVQYYSAPLGSSSFIQHGDVSNSGLARRFPHVFLHGPFNRWGFDAAILNTMSLTADSTWEMHFMYEWPAQFQVNIWGINPDNQPDVSFIYGDVNKDGILDRLPPSSLTQNVVNMTDPPAWPALSYKIVLNDALWKIEALPQGHVWIQILLFFLLAIVPIGLAGLAGWVYVGSFYQVKINKSGLSKKGWLPLKFSNISSMSIMSTAKPVEMSAITPTLAVTPDANPVIGGNGGRRTVLIATMEYNIDDWNISIKIGGLGVMAKLMSAALPHLDVVWVVPCVGDVEYPMDQPAESMFVKTMGQSHEVQVQYHHYKNITYVILDAPIFRAQTKADPYISRMDDIESAILYTAWNSCIAETIRRFPIDIYHINDYHGAAAPLYLLPQTIPCCLSLHNAEFQGMWPMRTPEEQKEVCDVFNLPLDVVKEYVQYGSVFNLLHAGASYLRVHQRGFGAVGVSKKYGDRSLARYPIFWSLKNIGQLPNPDPSDKDDWDPNQDAASNLQDIKVDQTFEQSRADLRRQAQEWAGLEVDPNAELFVFVGRWSLQKGVDLIADIFPSILEKYPSVQLICVGPVIDLYGKFAALKLEKLVAKYPRRVFSKPEFTALPPYIFSGAEFALIPSRDEPFGLVAVEFGRKGALGVGARVGGLGQMPGFWYTVESTSPSHLLHQFKQAIVSALEAKTEKRALMRAWSAKQRFPVAKWVQELDKLHSESIRIHNKEEGRRKKTAGRSLMRPSLRASTATGTYKNDGGIISPGAESPVISTPGRVASPLLRFDSPGLGTPTAPWTHIDSSPRSSIASTLGPGYSSNNASSLSVDSLAFRVQNPAPGESGLGLELSPPNTNGFYQLQGNSSQLSLPDVVGDRHDLKLQKVDLFFTDSNGEFYSEFEEMLEGLTAKNSATDLCIESFLKKSEKDWFARYRDAKLGRSRDASRTRSPAPSRPQSRNGESRDASVVSRGRQRMRSTTPSRLASVYTMGSDPTPPNSTMYLDDEFMLGDGYQAPTGLKKFLSIRVGDWPIYSFLLAFGQVISINSYQIVLLTGETSQTPAKLYIVASTYLVMSIIWWLLVRNFKSVYALSAPWIFFGLAFLFIGIAPLISDGHARGTIQGVATALYAAGASHGALAFALNFGDEGGAPTRQWITRALMVSGVAQAYALALWYWGSLVGSAKASPVGFVGSSTIPKALLICVPIAILLWGVGLVLFLGLPDYYRQSPETIPGFYISLARRKIVGWFFVMIIIQNYWLSAPYGRNWAFLFSSQFIPGWAAFLLALGFILGLWSIILYGFSLFSESHTWLLPIFAIGLAAPRWAQMLWGVSGIGMYLPWVASPVGGAVLSRCLWLWLGLLDAIQGVGLGMMLLATLTRMHVMAVLVGAQVVGSAFTMLAQATSPNAFHVSTTFPDFSQGLLPGIGQAWFWICLAFQLVIPLGFFKFFRKEQVAKP